MEGGPRGWRSVLELLGDGRVTDARARVEAALADAADPPLEPTWTLLQSVADGQSALARGQIDQLVRCVEHADSHLAAAHAPADARAFTLFIASLYQAAFRFTGRGELRDRGLKCARDVADAVAAPSDAVQARAILATIHILSGRLHATVDCCDAALELAAASGLESSGGAAMAHQFRGYALFEWNRLDEAHASLERAWTVADAGARGIRSGTARVMALVTAALGQEDASDEWVRRLEAEVAEPMTLRNREWLAAVRVLHGARGGRDLRALEAWSHRYGYPTTAGANVSAQDSAARLHEYDHLLTVLEATRQWPALESIANAMLRGAGDTRRWFVARGHAARSVALAGKGRIAEADQWWARALDEGEAEGFVRVYLIGSPLRMDLLERARRRAPERAWAERVLAAGRVGGGLPSALTPRQEQTLRHVASGLTNVEIAEAMGTSVSTTRTHLRAIFSKLGVRSRTAAVAEARRQGRL